MSGWPTRRATRASAAAAIVLMPMAASRLWVIGGLDPRETGRGHARRRSRKPPREGGDRLGHGFRLLWGERVAGPRNHDDRHTIAERRLQNAGKLARRDGVVFGL